MDIGIRASFLTLACCTLAACQGTSEPDCIDETRSLPATARLTSTQNPPLPGDTGTAYISLHEARNFASKATSAREILWFAGSSLARASVTAVHVHEQTTDRLLFTIPLDAPSSAPPYVIAQTFTRQPYAGTVDWTELYLLVGQERAYVEVHTTDAPGGRLRGVLRPENANWQSFTHAFCS